MTAVDGAQASAAADRSAGGPPAAQDGPGVVRRTAPWSASPAGGPSSPRWRRRRWLAAAVAIAAAVAGAGYAAAPGAADDPVAPPLGPGDVTVQLDVEYSLFHTEELRVVEGTRVRFVVVNSDPIYHELIVGPPDVHARHANGTEASHPSIPGEVSVGPNGTAVTTYRFDEPGTFEYACHLPGHYEHGMHGEVEVMQAV
jgi:uncharacterized cupredoxin-like copper-binding protein